jgi:CBS domain-containing protein
VSRTWPGDPVRRRQSAPPRQLLDDGVGPVLGSMHDAVAVMSEKRMGLVGVADDDGNQIGVITDGN